MDALSERNLIDLLSTEAKNKILIIISHKLSLIKDFDKIIVINDGMIIEEGKHNDLLRNQKLYNEMWNTQSRSYEL